MEEDNRGEKEVEKSGMRRLIKKVESCLSQVVMSRPV